MTDFAFDPKSLSRGIDYDPTSQQPFERIQLVVDGVPFEKWDSVTVNWEMFKTYVTFQLTSSEARDDGQYPNPLGDALTKWNFPPGTQVSMYATGNPFVSGYVNAYLPMANAEQHSVTVVGITKGKDFVDSSACYPTGTFENITDIEMVKKLGALSGQDIQAFGVEPELIPHWQIRQGATGFAEAMRALQPRQKMIVPRGPDGELTIISSMPFEVIPDANIIQGINVLQMSAKLTDDRFETISVIGQAVDGNEQQHLQPFGIAFIPSKFSGTPRLRQKRIIDQQSTTTQLAMKRALWEAKRNQGATTEVTVTVTGWREGRGQFWQINTDVYVNCPYLQVDCWLRIKKLVFRQSLASGTVTDITLADPQAFGGSVASCNSGPAWGFSVIDTSADQIAQKLQQAYKMNEFANQIKSIIR